MTAEERILAALEQLDVQTDASVVAKLTALWRSFGNLRDADAEKLLPRAERIIHAGQRTIARGTAASQRRLIAALGLPGIASPLDLDALLLRLGDTGARAAVVTVYGELADGAKYPVARERGLRTLLDIASDAMVRTRIQASAQVLATSGARGYRRVLTAADTCARCRAAAENIYTRADLKPVHNRCRCGVAPVA